MNIRFSKFRKISSLLGQMIIITVIVSQQADVSKPRHLTTDSFSFSINLEKQAVFQENSSNPHVSRTASFDWAFFEIVRDLPHIILKNSLIVWINDYAVDPFNISPHFNFP